MSRSVLLIAGVSLVAGAASSADLKITPHDPSRIVIDVLSDTHCPFPCGNVPPRCPDPPCPDSIACCDTFAAIVGNQRERSIPQDFTFINGDLGIDSNAALYPWVADRFFGYYDLIEGAKAAGVGNHEADAAVDTASGEWYWPDPENHYAPLNWWEPAFECDSTTALEDCRRWYSAYIGSPPRVAWLAVSNSSDEWLGDQLHYVWAGVPNDGLNHAASPQRRWLNDQIDLLPSTVDVVFVAGHRTYYGVEHFCCRPNILFSGLWDTARPETLRTGAVSFLRDLESIYARKPNVKRVFMISGDQHCFSETVPIRRNQAVEFDGVVYLTAGISGGWIGRGHSFPDLELIPSGALAHAFQDNWGSCRFEVTIDRVSLSVHEAYTDSLLHQSEWLLGPEAVAATEWDSIAAGESPSSLAVWPNPSREGPIRMELVGTSGELSIDEIAIYDVTGRRVRKFRTHARADASYLGQWDGTDEDGHAVGAGSYIVRVLHGDRTIATEKITITP